MKCDLVLKICSVHICHLFLSVCTILLKDYLWWDALWLVAWCDSGLASSRTRLPLPNSRPVSHCEPCAAQGMASWMKVVGSKSIHKCTQQYISFLKLFTPVTTSHTYKQTHTTFTCLPAFLQMVLHHSQQDLHSFQKLLKTLNFSQLKVKLSPTGSVQICFYSHLQVLHPGSQICILHSGAEVVSGQLPYNPILWVISLDPLWFFSVFIRCYCNLLTMQS